jgi:hypothetical protein
MNITRHLLVGAVALAAIAFSAAPSEAAKKKAATKCDPMISCIANCKGNTCETKRCEADGKVYSSLLPTVCIKPNCPTQKCG